MAPELIIITVALKTQDKTLTHIQPTFPIQDKKQFTVLFFISQIDG